MLEEIGIARSATTVHQYVVLPGERSSKAPRVPDNAALARTNGVGPGSPSAGARVGGVDRVDDAVQRVRGTDNRVKPGRPIGWILAYGDLLLV